MNKDELTPNDIELIDIAESTTYRNTIEDCIRKADTEKARQILIDILNSDEIEFEEEQYSRRW